MSKLGTRLNRLEEKLKVKQKTYTVVDWNTCKADNLKANKEIEEIKKIDPNAKIEILKWIWI